MHNLTFKKSMMHCVNHADQGDVKEDCEARAPAEKPLRHRLQLKLQLRPMFAFGGHSSVRRRRGRTDELSLARGSDWLRGAPEQGHISEQIRRNIPGPPQLHRSLHRQRGVGGLVETVQVSPHKDEGEACCWCSPRCRDHEKRLATT